MTPAQVDAVVAEAREWLRTPYVHMGRLKGIGVDCGMLLIEVYGNALGIEKPNVGNYTSDWYMHRDEPLYLGWLGKYAERMPKGVAGEPGDIAVFNFGRHPAHGGIVVEPGLMIHAYKPHGNVELAEVRMLDHRLDSYWRVTT